MACMLSKHAAPDEQRAINAACDIWHDAAR